MVYRRPIRSSHLWQNDNPVRPAACSDLAMAERAAANGSGFLLIQAAIRLMSVELRRPFPYNYLTN